MENSKKINQIEMVSPATKEYYNKLIKKEQIALKEFFAHYIPEGFRPKSIMDFCAGVANEEPVLRELYGEGVSLVSFDSSEYIVGMARDLQLDRQSLIKLDIGDFDNYFKNTQFDLLLGRNIPINPNRSDRFSNETYSDIWPDFIKNAKSFISDNGYLLMTLARDDEFERAQELLEKSGYSVLVQEENIVSVPSDMIGIVGADTKDNYVILARPTNTQVSPVIEKKLENS